MADVFISYKKEDRALAEGVAESLKAAGYSVWWDDDLTPRESWDTEIEREIEAAAAVMVLWTPQSVRSEWVRIEAGYGKEHNKLVPVMLEPCALPLAFRLTQTALLADWDGARDHREWTRAMGWLAALVGRGPGEGAEAPPVKTQRLHFRALEAVREAIREAGGVEALREQIALGEQLRAASPPPATDPVARAREAALDERPVAERSFVIDLPDVRGWPKPEMVVIPPGTFLMGSPEGEEGRYDWEGPQHQVRIGYPFAMGKHAVTVGAWRRFVDATGHDTGTSAHIWAGLKLEYTLGKGWRDPGFAQEDDHPVVCVNWNDAEAYLAWLNDRLGLGGRKDAYRLPSEAEWEYACRAGSQKRWSFGDDRARLGEHAWFSGNSGGETHPVGEKRANAFGLHDIHGNASEWCADHWHDTYSGAPDDGRAWLDGDDADRVYRGGCWVNDPSTLRSADRFGVLPEFRNSDLGFRLARTLPT